MCIVKMCGMLTGELKIDLIQSIDHILTKYSGAITFGISISTDVQ